MSATNPLETPNAPKLNDNFSNFFVINNLPKIPAEKIPKLVMVIQKSLQKKNLKIEDSAIEMPINPDTNETDGVAFVQMKNEDHARQGAQIFDGFKLTSKNIFAACLMPEFEKIMETREDFVMPEAAELEDLRSPVFDVKRDQYLYQSGKTALVNYFDPSLASIKKQGD